MANYHENGLNLVTSLAPQILNASEYYGSGQTARNNAGKRKEAINAERLRDEVDRKFSRIADAGPEEEVSCEPV